MLTGVGGEPVPLGLQGHTLVRTPYGDLPVSELTPGAWVETFEGGFREVRAVIQRRAWVTNAERCLEHWPLEVPAGALGNSAPLQLMQHQAVVYECDLVETMTGDPFVLLPVKALDGYGGIKPVEPVSDQLVYELVFDQPQAVCLGGGTYLLADDALSFQVAKGQLRVVDTCKALSWERARLLMSHIEADRPAAGPAALTAEAGL